MYPPTSGIWTGLRWLTADTHHFQRPSISKNTVAFHSHRGFSFPHACIFCTALLQAGTARMGLSPQMRSRGQRHNALMTSIFKRLRQQVNQISPFWGDSDRVTRVKKMGWMSAAVPMQQLICCGDSQVQEEQTRLRDVICAATDLFFVEKVRHKCCITPIFCGNKGRQKWFDLLS